MTIGINDSSFYSRLIRLIFYIASMKLVRYRVGKQWVWQVWILLASYVANYSFASFVDAHDATFQLADCLLAIILWAARIYQSNHVCTYVRS